MIWGLENKKYDYGLNPSIVEDCDVIYTMGDRDIGQVFDFQVRKILLTQLS